MLQFLIPFIGWSYLRLVALTSRIVTYGEEIPKQFLKQGKVFIFAFWHGRQFFLGYVRRFDPIDVLISRSRDGAYIAGTLAIFGIGSVRGSTSTGGSRALVQLCRSLKKGRLVAISPDGPKGPMKKVQPGVIYVARKMNAPIVPLAYAAQRTKLFYSWDEYHVPYPFNTIAVTYGEPYYVNQTTSIEDACKELEKRLNENTDLADTMVQRI